VDPIGFHPTTIPIKKVDDYLLIFEVGRLSVTRLYGVDDRMINLFPNYMTNSSEYVIIAVVFSIRESFSQHKKNCRMTG
jgi:hypothetical protein